MAELSPGDHCLQALNRSDAVLSLTVSRMQPGNLVENKCRVLRTRAMMFPTRLNLTFWQKLAASLAWLVALVMANLSLLSAQSNPIPTGNSSQPSQGLPFINAGPDSRFSQLDFAEMYLDQQNKRAKLLEEER